MDNLDIPVYQGMAKPMKQPFISTQDTHRMDGLGETNFPAIHEKQAEQINAIHFLATFLKKGTHRSSHLDH